MIQLAFTGYQAIGGVDSAFRTHGCKLCAGAPLQPMALAKQDWEAFPGIGPVIANRIIQRQKAEGPICSERDLLRVRGIGPATMRRISPYLEFNCVLDKRATDDIEQSL